MIERTVGEFGVCECGLQKFCFKTIKISQRPNHEKGFGFSVSGGREFSRPIVVEKVVRGALALFKFVYLLVSTLNETRECLLDKREHQS